jgi:hypothetical protein
MHRSFRLLLHEIRQKTDFNADELHLSVQYFPSREGGCELFICNLGDGETAPTEAAPAATALRPYQRRADCYRKECAFRFERLCDLLSVCRRLLGVGCICQSSVWRDVVQDYYLFLTVKSASPYSLPEELTFITEYGSLENEARLRVYIREHAYPICEENALEHLAPLA